MIRGVVSARREALLALRARGPAGVESVVDAVPDTGFTAALTLPVPLVTTLGLVRQSSSQALLADGSTRSFDVFAAEVEWDGVWRPVLVSAVGTEPLLGTGLLAGYEVRIAVVPGGSVEITPIP